MMEAESECSSFYFDGQNAGATLQILIWIFGEDLGWRDEKRELCRVLTIQLGPYSGTYFHAKLYLSLPVVSQGKKKKKKRKILFLVLKCCAIWMRVLYPALILFMPWVPEQGSVPLLHPRQLMALEWPLARLKGSTAPLPAQHQVWGWALGSSFSPCAAAGSGEWGQSGI